MESLGLVACVNNSTAANCSTDPSTNVVFEYFVRIIIPIIFGLIAALGFVGNLSVIVVVVANKNMRNTTNILIIGLAAADLVFIVVCVPFTAVIYVIPVWPFGLVWCKVRCDTKPYKYVNPVPTCFAAVPLQLHNLNFNSHLKFFLKIKHWHIDYS